MTAIKNLPTRLLRHFAKHPNSTIDGSFVNPKPVNERAKRQAEQDLFEAVYYLWECGDITPQPINIPLYQGTVTYKGLEKIDMPKKIIIGSIVTTIREIIVFSIGTAIGIITGSLVTILLR